MIFTSFCTWLLAGEDFLYGFKGARSAPVRGWQLGLDRRRATQALAQARRSSRPADGRVNPGKRLRAGRRPPP
jgi:hypothetical protein